MLRRLGPMALTIGSLFSAGSASAQAPVPYGGMATVPAMSGSASVTDAPPVNHAAPTDPRLVTNPKAFNPYEVYDEVRSRANHAPLWEAPLEKPSDYYRSGSCADGTCGHPGHGKLGHGKLGGLGKGDGRGLGLGLGLGDKPGLREKLGLDGDGADKDYGTGPNFDAANCWTRFNFEQKTFISYHYLAPLRTATEFGYGGAHGATVGTEWLAWVSRDDARHFSRWGVLTAFDFNEYEGNRDVILQSELSGNVLSSAGGTGLGFLIGPTFRTDFFAFGAIRMSPSFSAGLDLNWVRMREAQPNVFPPDPVIRPDPQPTFQSTDGAQVRLVEKFKSTDFCIGGYARLVFDFPIRQKLNVGVGMDYRISKTEAYVSNDDFRKHFGVIVQLTGEF